MVCPKSRARPPPFNVDEVVLERVIEDDGMIEDEFRDTMKGLHSEFSELNNEALALQAEIDKNMKELFG